MEISQFPQNFAKAQFKADEFTFNKQPQILFDSQNRDIGYKLPCLSSQFLAGFFSLLWWLQCLERSDFAELSSKTPASTRISPLTTKMIMLAFMCKRLQASSMHIISKSSFIKRIIGIISYNSTIFEARRGYLLWWAADSACSPLRRWKLRCDLESHQC